MTINKISGNILQDNLQRGANLAIQGNLFFVDVVNNRIGVNTSSTTSTLTVNGNAIISTSLDVTGNVIGGNLVTVGQVTTTGNVIGGNITTSGLITATGNITSAANISAANIVTTGIVFATGNITTSANVQGGNLRTAGLISATGNIIGGNVNTGGSISATANIVGGNVITGGIVSATGNVSGNYIFGNGSQLTGIDATSIQNGNSNVRVAANGNVSVGITGTSNVAVFATTGEYVTGIVSASGNITGNSVTLSANAISAASGILDLGSNANVKITGGSANYVLTTDGFGNVSWTAGNAIAGVLGNTVSMGTNSLGNLVSNAVTLTTSTTVTDGITQLNTVLGKLVPPSPPNFPNSTTLSITTATSSGRMCDFVQTDNTPGANKAVAAGTVVSVVRGSAYTTNTISNTGPGDSGTLTVYRNGAGAGNVAFNTGASPTANGTYSNLVVTNNYDYNTANANIAAGFWYVFSSRASGAVTQGWNEVYLSDSAAGNTNTPNWYYDAASPGTPVFSNASVTASASPSLTYSSTIPHYNSGTQFGFGFSVNKLSGDLYPNNGNLLTNSTAAGGAFQAPASVTYAAANVTVPLTQNLYVSSGSATGNTTANIVASGFGSSTTGPSVTVTNSYLSASQAFTTALAATVLYKNGNSTAIDEGNVVVTSVGTGSGNAFRIINPGSVNNPTYTGSEAAFNSQSGTLQTYDATVVGSASQGVLKHDQTNYATGYLPAGPNLSAGRSGTQYFTFKFVRTDVSKFDITYAGNVAGMWVALPGSVIDASSSANGWINMTSAYGGAGYPGVNSPGNGSDGCSLGGVVIPNVTTASVSKTCTFGTVSSSSTATNEIYVRIALTSGQSVTGLSLKAASN